MSLCSLLTKDIQIRILLYFSFFIQLLTDLKSIIKINKYNFSLRFPASISALCFDSTGSHLAIASSNAYEDPSIPPSNTPDEIFIRKVTDDETKPK